MKIAEFYKKSLFTPILFIFILQVFWGLFDYDPNYKSEWATSGTMFIWAIVIVIINAIIVSFLTIPIFLNNNSYIRDNSFLSLISWFLMPLIWLGYLIGRAVLLFIKNNLINEDVFFLLLNTIPYIVGLIWSFIIFRQALKNTTNPHKQSTNPSHSRSTTTI